MPGINNAEHATSIQFKCIHTYIQTYIHNCSLQPFSQDYGQASHTTHDVCVNFIRKWRDLQFNIDFERQIFLRNFLMTGFIYFQNFWQKCAERKSPKKYFFIFGFWCLPWDTNLDFMSTKPTHYTTRLWRLLKQVFFKSKMACRTMITVFRLMFITLIHYSNHYLV